MTTAHSRVTLAGAHPVPVATEAIMRTRLLRHLRTVSSALPLLLLLLLLDAPAYAQDAATRGFRMGFTPFTHDATPQATREMRAFLAENADVLAVHLDGVPWVEALADKPYHPKLMQEWQDKSAARPPQPQGL